MSKSSRVRVVRVITRMNVGGPAIQVSTLARGLDPGRFEQRLLTGAVCAGEEDYRELRAHDVQADFVPGLGRSLRPLDDLRALAALRRTIRLFRPHIVHTHTAKAGTLGRIAARMAGVPALVHTFHGHMLHDYFSPAATRTVVLTERALARTTTRLVAVGALVRDELLAAGVGRADQYRIVPPGVDLSLIPGAQVARKELDLPYDARVIAFIGRLTAVKRPDRLIDVVSEVIHSRPETVLLIAGEGDLLGEVHRRSAPLGDRVRFLGWRADVETVLAASDVVLLTSDSEGMPVSLIEAAAAGRPAVTTDVGSAAEVVDHGVTGFVTTKETTAIADAMRALLDDDSLRERMGVAAAARAHAKFSSQRLVADMEDLYEEIAEREGFE